MPSCDYNKDFKHPNVVKVDYSNIKSVTYALKCMRKVLDRKPGEELVSLNIKVKNYN
jgi:hypothetical protein